MKNIIDIKDGYVKFTESYTNSIFTSLGGWMELKSTDLGGIKGDILNNIPLISYNYEYKAYQLLTLNSITLIPARLNQAVDIVINNIRISSGYPRELDNTRAIVHTKKELAREVFKRKVDTIHVVLPKNNASIQEQTEFYNKMTDYLNVITRYLYIKSRSKLTKITNIIYGD